MRSPLPFALTFIFLLSTGINAQLSTVTLRNDTETPGTAYVLCNGVLEVRAMGDSGPFTVKISYTPDDPNSLPRVIHSFSLAIGEGKTIENACAGSYEVVYTNRFGCEFIDNTRVTQCGKDDCCNDFGVYQSSYIDKPDPNECGAGSCQLGVYVSTDPQGLGGVTESSVTYNWSTGASGNHLQNICSGSYTVTATSDFGCSASKTFNLCCAGVDIVKVTNAVPGGSLGSVEYNLLSDVPITSLSLNGNPISLVTNRTGLSNLAPGSYMISFQTVPGCSAFAHFSIDECEDLGPDTFETLSPTRDNCSTSVDVSMDDPFEFNYRWQDGNTRRSRSLNCDNEYSVTITSKHGCGEVIKTFLVCESLDNFNLNDFIVSSDPETQAGNDGQVTLRLPLAFATFLNEVYDESTSRQVSFSNFQSSGIVRLEDLAAGTYQLRFASESGCSLSGSITIHSCALDIDESNVVLSNIRAVGEFFNDQLTPVKIIADVEVSPLYEGYPFKYQLVYQHLTVNNFGTVLRSTETVIRSSPEFYIPSFTTINNLAPTIRVLHPCTEEVLSSITVEELTSCTSPFPDVFMNDQCVNRAFSRTWYKVTGLMGGRGFVQHRISKGDILTVTREYKPALLSGEGHSVTYQAKVEEIEQFQNENENLVRVIISGANEKHIINKRNTPGTLTVTFMLEDGSCLEPTIKTIGKKLQPPIPHILGGGNPLAERRLFRGIANDFWLGYMMNCTACTNTEQFFDEIYTDNDRCDSDRIVPFEYEPYDPNRPCTGGGKLMLPPEVGGGTGTFADPVELEVYPSGRSRLIRNGPQCGCIFEPNDVQWPDNGPAIGLTLRVYAEFECSTNTTDEPPKIELTETEILTLCELYSASSDCEECDIATSPDGCSFNLICKVDNRVIRKNIQRERDGAYQGGTCYLVLPDNSRPGLFDIFEGEPCEVSPCNVDGWVWFDNLDALTSIEVEQYREYTSISECPEFYCSFQSGDITSLIGGTLEDFYNKSFESDEFAAPQIHDNAFTLFPNPALTREGKISLFANRQNITEWKAYSSYGHLLAQSEKVKLVGQNSEILINLDKGAPRILLIQVWLSSGEYFVKKIVIGND